MKRIALFANGELGLRILDALIARDDCEVSLIILNHEAKRDKNFLEKLEHRLPSIKNSLLVESYHREIWENEKIKESYREITHALSILFGHIIPKSYLDKQPGRILNLHPSLLPIGRGADPVAWSILEGNRQGVSIHEITASLDSGRLAFQKEIYTDLSATAGSVYIRAMEELWQGFNNIVDKWLNDELILEHQSSGGSSHKSIELDQFRNSILKNSELLERAIRIINALTYADGRRATFRDSSGLKWKAEIHLRRVED